MRARAIRAVPRMTIRNVYRGGPKPYIVEGRRFNQAQAMLAVHFAHLLAERMRRRVDVQREPDKDNWSPCPWYVAVPPGPECPCCGERIEIES